MIALDYMSWVFARLSEISDMLLDRAFSRIPNGWGYKKQYLKFRFIILLGFYFLPCIAYSTPAMLVIDYWSCLESINANELFYIKKYFMFVLIFSIDVSCLTRR